MRRTLITRIRSAAGAPALEAERGRTRDALAALAAAQRRAEVLRRAGQRLAGARDLGDLADVALAELAQVAGAGDGALWVIEPEPGEHLVLEAALGVDPALLPGLLRGDESPAGRAVATREPVAVHGTRDELHLPLLVGDATVGVATLRRDTPFGETERETLEQLAEQVAVAVANAVSYRAALRAARVNRAVLDATPDPVGLLGVDGQLIAHNAAMGEVRSRHPGFEELTADAGDEARSLVTLGERTYARYAGPVHDETGEQMGLLVVLRDVTAERESERLKDEFFALVSHELRTPLTSIIGYLELVEDDAAALPPDIGRFLEVVDRNAKRLLRLVGDLLFVAQADAGRLSLERVAVDLGQIVADAVEAARPAAERGGVALRLEAEAVQLVDGDRDRLGQLVDNLVSNALKFTGAGGEVVVTLRPDATGTVQLAVSDDGVGIPDAEQQHLFERFFRSSSSTTRAVPGAGLGLTIAKTIVEVHEGRISLASTEGVGTTVRVRLPRSSTSP